MTDWAELCRTSLLDFTQEVFYQRRNVEWLYNWHHQAICDALERVVLGDIKRLIINCPPRYSKTELAVVNFMAWCIGNYPDSEFIHASYSKRLATNNAYNCRALVMSEVYRQIFPEVNLMDDSKAKDEWRTTQGGVVYATGADGTITGYGAGKIRQGFAGAVILDDPHKAGEAESDIMRQNVIDWFQTTMESRLNSPETPIILIMQRLHQNDLSGWLLEGGNGEHWDNLVIPVLDANDKPLWPAKHNRETLARMEAANPYVFAGQYLQIPAPRSGGMVKVDWLARTRYRTPPETFIKVVQSWDTAFKAAEINDPSVCTTWGEAANGYYLLDCFVIRGDYPTVKRAIQSKYAEFKPDVVLIEDKASGQSLIQELRQLTDMAIVGINPEGDKLSRMYAACGAFESGRVWVPESAAWLSEYEAELFLFPMAKHDDRVDSTSQYINWARKGGIYTAKFMMLDEIQKPIDTCSQCEAFNALICGLTGYHVDVTSAACELFYPVGKV